MLVKKRNADGTLQEEYTPTEAECCSVKASLVNELNSIDPNSTSIDDVVAQIRIIRELLKLEGVI